MSDEFRSVAREVFAYYALTVTFLGPATDDIDAAWRLEQCERLKAYSLARKQSQIMTDDEKQQFLGPHLAQWKLFLESRPSRSSADQSSVSQITSLTPNTAAASGSTTPNSSRQTNVFSALQGLKRKNSKPDTNRPVIP